MDILDQLLVLYGHSLKPTPNDLLLYPKTRTSLILIREASSYSRWQLTLRATIGQGTEKRDSVELNTIFISDLLPKALRYSCKKGWDDFKNDHRT